ncbi:unnamed protein product [Clavelina lepadiformis]|uniref:Uncharacterized protein n=1 Tax=Clavelina lepadiformis TaxID=159417 RepID=A0ABP0GKK1_CLALP
MWPVNEYKLLNNVEEETPSLPAYEGNRVSFSVPTNIALSHTQPAGAQASQQPIVVSTHQPAAIYQQQVVVQQSPILGKDPAQVIGDTKHISIVLDLCPKSVIERRPAADKQQLAAGLKLEIRLAGDSKAQRSFAQLKKIDCLHSPVVMRLSGPYC